MAEWMGTVPMECDLCRRPVVDSFFDFRTDDGRWACGCRGCFVRVGSGLGPGRGQKFDKQENGKWLKTGG